MIWHQEQLQFMIDLAQHRIGFLDPFFRFLNYFDTDYFFFLLIPLIWIGFSYQWGIRIFYWLTLNNAINSAAKLLIGWPRPNTEVPEIGMFHPTSFGFPSGGAQTCMFLGSILIYHWRSRAAWIIGTIYILLLSFSRLYLGVHYPIDILGGWAIALSLFFAYVKWGKAIETYLIRKRLLFALILTEVIPLIIFILFPKIRYVMGSVMGIGLGTYFSLKYRLFLPPPKRIINGICRGLFAAAILFVLYLLWPKGSPLYVKSFALGLFMSLGVSPIMKKA